MNLNSRLSKESCKLLSSFDDQKGYFIRIYSHSGFYTSSLVNSDGLSFGDLKTGKGVWRFTDLRKGIRSIRRHSKQMPIVQN